MFGLILTGEVASPTLLGTIIGVFGVVVVLAASGVLELAMALWYRGQRSLRLRRIHSSE
jgi:hypothetical protein